MTGKARRPKLQRERDLQTIAELRLKGWSQQAIADYLEVEQSTISRDFVVLQKRWKEASIRDFDEERGMQLERLELLEKEYWNAWIRSQQNKETSLQEQLKEAIADVVEKESGGRAGGRTKVSKRVETRSGDAAFLNGIGKCISERSKLLGLYQDEPRDQSAEDTLKGYISYLSASKQEKPKDDSLDQ